MHKTNITNARHDKPSACQKTAFSLVEMLMALLVASLLLAALAPVMTRRMADHELKVMSESSNYEKDNRTTSALMGHEKQTGIHNCSAKRAEKS